MDQELAHLSRKERRKLYRLKEREERKKQTVWGQYRRWGWRIASIFIIIGILTAIVKFGSSPTPVPSLSLNEKDWYKGGKEAKVALFEYSDFECPACAFYSPIIGQLTQEYKEKILFAYRHFPLKTIHENAALAAAAAEAAGRQGKFWEMHDLLFEKQKEWSGRKDAQELLSLFARQLDLSEEKFKSDLNSKEVIDKIESDLKGGERLGVNATPSFFLNGRKLDNPKTLEEFRSLIEKEIAKE